MNASGRFMRFRPFVGLALKATLALVLLIVIFNYVSLSDVATAFLNSRPGFLIGAIALVIANVGLQIYKWRYFVRIVDSESSTYESTAAVLLGITLGSITPGQLGEIGGRALRHKSSPTGLVIGLTLVDKVQMLCVMGIAGTVGMLILFHVADPFNYLIGFTSTAAFLFLFFGSKRIASVVLRINPVMLARLKLAEFLSAFGVLKSRALTVSFCLSLAFYVVLYAQMYFLLNAFEPVGPGDAFLGFSAMMFFKSLVPISLGDLGIREASSVYFYSLCGIAHATALNASLLLFVINILLPSLVGLVFIPRIRPE